MTVAALILLGLAIAAFLVFLRDEREAHARQLADFNLQAEAERRELLTRIQHPQIVPNRRVAAARPAPPSDAKALAQIGTFAAPGDNADPAA